MLFNIKQWGKQRSEKGKRVTIVAFSTTLFFFHPERNHPSLSLKDKRKTIHMLPKNESIKKIKIFIGIKV